MRYRYYRVGGPITDNVIPKITVGLKTTKVFKPVGEVRCVVPYFSEHLNSECYGFLDFGTGSGEYPPPAIMHDGWSPLYVIMDASDEIPVKENDNGNGKLQR